MSRIESVGKTNFNKFDDFEVTTMIVSENFQIYVL